MSERRLGLGGGREEGGARGRRIGGGGVLGGGGGNGKRSESIWILVYGRLLQQTIPPFPLPLKKRSERKAKVETICDHFYGTHSHPEKKAG